MAEIIISGKVINFCNNTSADISANEIVYVGDFLGIAIAEILIGNYELVDFKGVYTLDKTSGESITQGELLYFNKATKKITKTQDSNVYAGVAYITSGITKNTVTVVFKGSTVPLPTPIEDTAVSDLPIEIDGTVAVSIIGKIGWGNVLYDPDEKAEFNFYSNGAVVLGSSTTGFSDEVDNAGTVNIYQDGTNIIIQNKTGSDISIAYSLRS